MENNSVNNALKPLQRFKFNIDSILSTPKVSVNRMAEEPKNVCGVCSKVFSQSSKLRLHMNIHYYERPFRCESCGTSYRTKAHLTKHERSASHNNKVNKPISLATRPFKCVDCQSAFRIQGHLAKHLRSRMHIMKLECLKKLPFGTYAEIEQSDVNLNDIDTTDCAANLSSLQDLARKLHTKEPTELPTVNYSNENSVHSDKNNHEQSQV